MSAQARQVSKRGSGAPLVVSFTQLEENSVSGRPLLVCLLQSSTAYAVGLPYGHEREEESVHQMAAEARSQRYGVALCVKPGFLCVERCLPVVLLVCVVPGVSRPLVVGID